MKKWLLSGNFINQTQHVSTNCTHVKEHDHVVYEVGPVLPGNPVQNRCPIVVHGLQVCVQSQQVAHHSELLGLEL